MGEAAHMRTIVSAKAITLPGGGDVHLIAPPPKPCVTILVHGVNDLAGCYARIESGLCQGLNERLDMPETLPGGINNPGYMRSAGYGCLRTTPAKLRTRMRCITGENLMQLTMPNRRVV